MTVRRVTTRVAVTRIRHELEGDSMPGQDIIDRITGAAGG